jgi:exodeoxyribonuclease VII large subunit
MSSGPEAPVRVLPVKPKTLTVAEFNRTVKGTLEREFSSVLIEGEISGCKLAASGHAYFDLKDDKEEARVACCLFKNVRAKVTCPIRDGERVVARARASLYPQRGSFQLILEGLQAAGAGNAAAALEALKKKLAAEGLFANERKRPLPEFPRTVGVVTSQRGAAFADVCRVLHRRWPVRIVVADTLVQGNEAPAMIVDAIGRIQRLADLDLVIVGRGGGSSEDLAAFNDENVARAIAACRVPVISAVGHEIDHTVADLVADVRAATPSNAAELAVPELRVVLEEISGLRSRAEHAAMHAVSRRRVWLQRAEKRLGDPRRFTDDARQRIDDAMGRAQGAMRKALQRRHRALDEAHSALTAAHPKTRVERDRKTMEKLEQRLRPAVERALEARARRVDDLRERLEPAAMHAIEQRRALLGTRAAQLSALSPLAILSRGYGVVLAKGKAVTHASALTVGESVRVRLHEGELDATVTAVHGGKNE